MTHVVFALLEQHCNVKSYSQARTMSASPNPSIARSAVPVYCLTQLTEPEQAAYEEVFGAETGDDDGGFVKPYLVHWTLEANGGKEEGDMKDLFRLWREENELSKKEYNKKIGEKLDESHRNFAFFIDRAAVPHLGIIVAAPPFLGFPALEDWAKQLLEGQHKHQPEGTPPLDVPPIDAVDALDMMYDEIVKGEAVLAWGRLPASELRLAWCNSDIGNMDMSEYVEFTGRKDEVADEAIVQLLLNEDFDEEAFAKKFYDKFMENSSVDA
ncbi:hypothetical protein F4778DRAFT_744525 [Xylariomycetidae sp. FL2044]|nr:hypothetical protein F4778DRAFT_744525 [Xylariomycetidae sp. FL2044]